MSAPTVTVTATISGQDGLPVEGATVTMVMDRAEFYQGFVVKESVSATTNASGVATLAVFPNALGANGSQYKVTIITPEQTIRSTAVVPNSNCNLHDIMQVPPYPAISLSQAAMTAAQNYAAQAGASASTASGHATTAGTYAGTATSASTSAQSFSLASAASASTASNAALSATASAAAASSSAAAAAANAASIAIGVEAEQIPKNWMLGGLAYVDADPAATAHAARTDNPHSATASQVGLGNVTNVAQLPLSYLDTDGTLAANSDTKVASQKAVKTYVDAKPTGGKWMALSGAFGRTSDSQMTVNSDVTSTIKAGMALRYTVSGTVYYGVVTAVSFSSSTTITIVGAPCTSAPSAIEYGDATRVVFWSRVLWGAFSDAADSALLANDNLELFDWPAAAGKAYLVWFRARPTVDDSGASQPNVNMTIAGNNVCTSSTLAVSDASWAATTGTNISTANYSVSAGQRVEVTVDANGTNKDGKNLTVQALFVLE